MDAVFGNTEQIRIQHYIQPLPDSDYAKLGQAGNTDSLEFDESLKQTPAEIPALKALFGEKLTYS
ncbi:MAG: hypothetical protein LBF88_10600, partial [Planctomycetaceae bacterium]|nr:hypothetical protein [Planctomycetaceae bacterium]